MPEGSFGGCQGLRLPPRSFPAQLCAPGGPSWSPCTQICRDPSQTGQNHDPMVHIAFWRKPSCAPTLVWNSREVLLGVANLWKTKAAVFEGVGGTSLSKVHITGPKLGCIQFVSWNAHLSSGLCSGKPLSVGIWSLWFFWIGAVSVLPFRYFQTNLSAQLSKK